MEDTALICCIVIPIVVVLIVVLFAALFRPRQEHASVMDVFNMTDWTGNTGGIFSGSGGHYDYD